MHFETSQFACLFLGLCSLLRCSSGSWWWWFLSDRRGWGLSWCVISIWSPSLGRIWCWHWWFLLPHSRVLLACFLYAFFYTIFLHQSATPDYIRIYYVWCNLHVLDTCSLFSLLPRITGCPAPGHLSSCISLPGCCSTVCRHAVSSDSLCAPSLAIPPYLCFSKLYPVSSLPKACCQTRLTFSVLQHDVRVRNMVIPWKDEQKQNELAVATWAVSKAVVTAKPSKKQICRQLKKSSGRAVTCY